MLETKEIKEYKEWCKANGKKQTDYNALKEYLRKTLS